MNLDHVSAREAGVRPGGRSLQVLFAPLLLLLLAWAGVAESRELQSIDYSVLAGNRVQVRLEMSAPAPEPGSFTIDNPARIAIDLPETGVALENRFIELDAGPARSIRAVQAGGRTRVVLSLTHLVPYEIESQGNMVLVNIGTGAQADSGVAEAPAAAEGEEEKASVVPRATRQVTGIDFRRGREGEGRVIVSLDPGTVVDMQERSGKIVVNFIGARVPEDLSRRLNVVDFATPVTSVDTYNTEVGVRMVVDAVAPFEHLAYQTGGSYTLEVKPKPKQEGPRAGGGEDGYTGERLSLNFQNIEVRAVLQLIADFTGLNIVASDTVRGNITLRLKNVPWDQALDIILKTKGLGMRQSGNVVLIAPNEELAAREKQELEAQQQLDELVPLRTEYFQINYAKATDIAALLKSGENSILSDRGNVTIDERTNTLMVLDTQEKLTDVARLIEKLDIPIRQVLIESRIVVANDDYSRQIGVKTGFTSIRDGDGGPLTANSTDMIGVGGSTATTDTMVGSALDNLADTGTIAPVEIPGVDDRLNVNLPVAGNAGTIALAILGSDFLVDLELSALQQEGRGEVISSPRVITANQKEATIKQGVEIPYQEASASGATSVSFKEAVLALTVTPQITPDDRIIMDLEVSKDSQGQVVNGIPTINTRSVETQVLVDNGDTVVLGGIYEQTRSEGVDKVPLLGDLPVLGALFRTTRKEDDKAELLIFVTPKILKEGLNASFE